MPFDKDSTPDASRGSFHGAGAMGGGFDRGKERSTGAAVPKRIKMTGRASKILRLISDVIPYVVGKGFDTQLIRWGFDG